MTDDIEKPEEWALAAEYTLGLLPPDEARKFEAQLSRDPAMRADYAFWAEHYAGLTDDIPEVTPPASVWKAISAAAFGAEEKRSWLSRFGLPSALGGGLIAALAVLWLVDLSGMMGWLDKPAYTAEIVAEDKSLIVQASYDEDSKTLSLTRSAGVAVEGRALELWLISGDNAPVSLGVLPESQTARITLEPVLASALQDGVLAISDEPAGGSPTGAPTGAVLAAGPVISL